MQKYAKYEKVCKIKSMQKICQSIQRYEKYLIAQKGMYSSKQGQTQNRTMAIP